MPKRKKIEKNINQDRIILLEKSIELVLEAKELVDKAVEETSQENYYKAYGRYGFNRLLGEGNPYDEGLLDLIEKFKGE